MQDAVEQVLPSGQGWLVTSSRAGGPYVLTEDGEKELPLRLEERARLTTFLIDERRKGNGNPQVTSELIDAARNPDPMPVYDRATRLLRYLADTSTPSASRPILRGGSNLMQRAFGHAEIARGDSPQEQEELRYLVDYLVDKGFVKWGSNSTLAGYPDSCVVTVDGYRHMEDFARSIDDGQAFVAMWFDDEMFTVYEEAICPGVEDAHYKPFIITQGKNVRKLDDAIISSIRRSRFLIADFTQGRGGARGSVYYEAGFAHGLGKDVIFTCRKDKVNKLHFDVRQYLCITWEKDRLEDFQRELTERIVARLGEGPEHPDRSGR